MIAQYIQFAMAAVLITAMVLELRTGRIPNWLTLIPFVLFIILAATSDDRTALAWQLGAAAVVFAVGLLLFIFAGIGAGAVKLLAGMALFVPVQEQGLKALGILLAVMFVGTFVVIQIRRFAGSEDSKWHVLSKNVMPLSLPIGIAGLAVLFWL